MKTTRLFSGLGLLSTLAIAADASAGLPLNTGVAPATTSGGATTITINHRFPPFCPSPSLSVCQQESGATDSCATQNHATCVSILKSEFQTEYLDPASYGASPGELLASTGPAQGVVVPYDQRRVGFQWNADATYSSQMASVRLPMRLGVGVSAHTLSASLAPLHPEWETNGGAITPGTSRGCAEYAFEKNYDYERFEDAAASCLDDHACIYDVGVLAQNPGIAEPQLKQRDGALMADQLSSLPPVAQPKNAFFAVSPYPILQMLRQVQGAAPYDLGIALGNIQTRLQGFDYAVPDRFAWHRQMHDAQIPEGLGAIDYRAMEQRQAAYAALVQQYESVKASLPSATWMAIVQGVTTTTCDGTTTHGVQTTNPNGTTNCTSTYAPTWFPVGSAAAFLQKTMFDMAHALVSEWWHVNPASHVVDHGCLDANSNRCDWEPKMFARDYVGLFQKHREADYERCVADTGDNLAVNPSYAYAPSSSELASTAAFEGFLSRVETAYRALTKDVPQLGVSGGVGTGAPATVGNEASGGHSLGDPDWFAADYSYDSLWSLHFGQNNGQICSADGEIRGALNADVTIFDARSTIVNAYFDLTAGRGGSDGGVVTTYFKIFGQDLYSPVTNGRVGGSAGQWNLSQSRTMDGPSAQIVIPVLGVPLTIKAGANMSFGFDANANVSVPQGCIPNQGNGTYTVLTAGGGLTPWAAVDAFVWGGIDADVASIGIQANLNLITAKLPISATLSLDFDGNNMAQVDLNATTNLELAELSGSVDAVATLGPCSVDKEIFAWDGLHQTIPIYSFQKAYPLTAMSFWLHGHGG